MPKIASLSFYGFSMMWSPVFGTSEAAVFGALYAHPDLLTLSRIINLTVLALFMLAAAYLGDRLRPLLHHGPFVPATVAVGCLGMLLGCVAGLEWAPAWVLLPGAAARGFYAGAATILWIGLFIHADRRIVGAAAAGSLTLYAAYGLLVAGAAFVLPGAAAVMLVASPLLSYAGCRRGNESELRSQPVAQEETPAPPGTRVTLYAANFVFGVILGGLLYFFAMEDAALYVAAFLAASALCLVGFALLGSTVDLRLAFRILMLCYVVAASAVALLAPDNGALILTITSAALAVILLYTIIIFLDTQARFRKPYWRIPGLTQVFASVGMIAASAGLAAVPGRLSAHPLALVALAAACLMFIASVFLSEGGFSSRPWGFSSLIPAESPEMMRVRRCGDLAAAHRLTTRELEILQLLASGSTRENVAEALFISPATAKTHIRNIYAKLSVHSQRELEELLDAS